MPWESDKNTALSAAEQSAKFKKNSTIVEHSMCSGSPQPSRAELKALILDIIKKQLQKEVHPIRIVLADLRAEAHFYREGEKPPIGWSSSESEVPEYSFADEHTLANTKEFTSSMTIGPVKTEQEVLDEITAEIIMQFPDLAKIGLEVKSRRFPVIDGSTPSDEVVEDFIKFATSLEPNTWVHIHCHGGKGRTSAFVAMYNTIYLALHPETKVTGASPNDHRKLSPKSTDDEKGGARHLFITQFSNFVASTGLSAATEKWSEWRSAQSSKRGGNDTTLRY